MRWSWASAKRRSRWSPRGGGEGSSYPPWASGNSSIGSAVKRSTGRSKGGRHRQGIQNQRADPGPGSSPRGPGRGAVGCREHVGGAPAREGPGPRSCRGGPPGRASGLPDPGFRQVQVHHEQAGAGGEEEADRHPGQGDQGPSEDGGARPEYEAKAYPPLPRGGRQGQGDRPVPRQGTRLRLPERLRGPEAHRGSDRRRREGGVGSEEGREDDDGHRLPDDAQEEADRRGREAAGGDSHDDRTGDGAEARIPGFDHATAAKTGGIGHAEDEIEPGREQAVSRDGDGRDQARQVREEPHPDVEGPEAEAGAAQVGPGPPYEREIDPPPAAVPVGSGQALNSGRRLTAKNKVEGKR